MKKAFLLAAVAAAFTAALTGCNDDDPVYRSDRNFAVKNATDRTIVVTGAESGGWYIFTPITIAPGESKFVFTDILDVPGGYGYGSYYGDVEDYNRKDELNPDYLIPFGDGESVLDMTVGETKAPAAVWQRKHWDFMSNYTDTFYTLTVTDALLESLSPAGPDPDPEQ